MKKKLDYNILDFGEACDYSKPFRVKLYNAGIYFYGEEIIYGWERDYGVRSYEFKLRLTPASTLWMEHKKSSLYEDLRFIHTMDLKSLPVETFTVDFPDNKSHQYDKVNWDEFLNQNQPELFKISKDRLDRKIKGVIPPSKFYSDSYISTPHEFLQFTEESAPSWGGPFELDGSFGACITTNDKSDTSNFPIGPVEENWASYYLPYDFRDKSGLTQNKVYSYPPEKKREVFNSLNWDVKLYVAQEYIESFKRYPNTLRATLPFSLCVFGNDDRRFYKFFGSEEDREKEINYLRMMQPLDFEKDIREREYYEY